MSKKKPMRLVSPAIPEEDLVATSDDEGPPFMDSGSSDKLVSSTSSQFVRRQAAASGLGTMDNSGDYGTFIKSENSEISITAADGAWTQVTLKNLHKREQHATTYVCVCVCMIMCVFMRVCFTVCSKSICDCWCVHRCW